MKTSLSSKTFDTFNVLVLALLCCITIYPFVYVFSSSVSDSIFVESNAIKLFPKGFNLSAYEKIIDDRFIWMGYYNTIIYTVFGTLLTVVLVFTTAYPLSKKSFIFVTFFTFMITITMFFSGGLIPNYLLANALGMVNTRWALIIPGALGAMNVFMVRTFLRALPEALDEAALIDGANEIQILVKIVIPLSKPIFATIALFTAVHHWNAFMPAMIYLQDPKLFPLQVVLYKILIESQTMDRAASDSMALVQVSSASIKYAIIIVSTLPILLVYPFVQKYFVKGIVIGSIKG